MDRDTESIGGIEHPLLPHKQLFYVTLVMDVVCITAALFVSPVASLLLSIYVIFSRLYSYRGIRLKKYAVPGYLTVILNQGGLIFLTVYLACNQQKQPALPWLLCIASCLLIGGFYPITQIYQHQSDERDGVQTISMVLGKNGTFIFCAFMYIIAFSILFNYYFITNNRRDFYVLQLFFIPVILYFTVWFFKVIKNKSLADFKHTMRMNWIASICSNLAFITLVILHNT